MQIKLLLVCLLFLSIPQILEAQYNIGVSYHQSQNTRVGGFLEIRNKVLFDFRILDFTRIEDTTVEMLGSFKITTAPDHEIYLGIGYGLSPYSDLTGVIGAIGINIYPFEQKKLGFHIEVNPIFPEEPEIFGITRASWGIRYRFKEQIQ